ncbi:MAG: DUF771 domain-containing protein [Streptococcus orisratti]|uniref:DUF771 domain-containing protein n=1 Tax=Streptococcus orisratti TaxID=114652 RepID=UPI002A889F8A|nr:DUF771 domain-containing protein [Streptococcus orisratti]MDY4002114.1 DUF771 domain-containing protein [Streptococcus orisratti]MDY5636731.1 DUF771 domain-containing protein [Streptococcus orisratti]
MNKIIVDLQNIVLELPESKIIVDREEYEHLKEKTSKGRYLTLNEVLELLSVSRPWLLENVLYNPEIRSQIDIDQNPDGFVKYPHNQGGRYFFLASRTRDYFETHFAEIMR